VTASAHWRAVSAEHLAELRRERRAGSWHGYASALFGGRQVDALPRLGEARADVRMATVGAAQRAAGDLWWGAAVSVAGHDNEVSGAALDSETLIGSVQGTWRRGGLYLSGAAQLGRSAIDIVRSLRPGPSVRHEEGGTAAGQYGLDLDLGWTFQEADGLSQGLAAGVSWLVQEVDGYRESGNSSTAMNFSAFRRCSLVLRAGYRISEDTELEGLAVRPYAGLAYERELNDDPVSVTAGSNTMPGRFSAPGYAPPGGWLNVDIGIAASLGGGTHAVVGYSGRTGSGERRDHLLTLGLRAVF
jgi:outer membrane lipase/esterase